MDPDKKKTIVVGALFVAMLGIGAFQFSKMGGEGGGAAPEPKPEESKPAADEKSTAKGSAPKNPMYAGPLPGRDPFRPAAFSVSLPEAAAPVLPAATPAGKVAGRAIPMPNPMPGELPPMGLPSLGGTAPNGPLAPAVPAEPRFEGALIGVLVGANSAAVFRLGASERIVTIGSEIEPGVRLLSVSPRKATVRFHAKTITLHLTDEAHATKPNAAPSSTPSPLPKSAPTPSPADNPSETPND